jgi:hypothetical protein
MYLFERFVEPEVRVKASQSFMDNPKNQSMTGPVREVEPEVRCGPIIHYEGTWRQAPFFSIKIYLEKRAWRLLPGRGDAKASMPAG